MMLRKFAAVAALIGLAACSGMKGTSPVVPGTAGHMQSTAIAAPPGWSATATQAITVPNATATGTLDPNTPMHVSVGMNLRNVDALKAAIESGQIMSQEQFMANYGPAASDVQSVTSYLAAQGFTNIVPEGQLISANGTAAVVSKAFNTTLQSFAVSGGSVYANTTPAFVPSTLGGMVSAVLGLSDAAKMAVHPQATCVKNQPLPNGQCAARFYAADVQQYYDAAPLPPATNTSVAVIAEGDVSGTVTDLRYAEAQQHLPQVPVSVVNVGLKSPDTAGVGEWDLDTQSSTGMAQNVKMLYLYVATSLTDSDIALTYNKWVSQNLARTGNSSFGECEYSAFLDGALKVDDNLFMQAAAQGQTMFASTGDVGSSCPVVGTNGVPGSGPPMVSYPAASPWVVAVGGTSVIRDATDGHYVGETAWDAGGGGLSQFENGTSWEFLEQPVQVGAAATNLRGLPDIALAADAFAGAYEVYGTNIPGVGDCSSGCAIGGTSESSPLSMGAYARIASAHNNSIGFAAPLLYRTYNAQQNNATTVTGPPPTQSIPGFHDIITGGNGVYTALPNYDYTTGLGTLDVAQLSNLIGH